MAIQLIPGGLLAIGTFFLCESPALLLRRGKDTEAMRNLTYLRKLPAEHRYIREEVGMIMARIEEERDLSGGKTGLVGYLKGAMKELNIRHIRHRL